MKSKHRHELQTNELADGLSHIGDFTRKNSVTIIGVVLIVIGLLTWGPIKAMRYRADFQRQANVTRQIGSIDQNKILTTQSRQQNTQAANRLLLTANYLEIAAKEAKNPQLAALALIKRGETLRADLHYSGTDAEPEIVRSQIAEATKSYQQAIKKAGDNASLVAMAKFGIGLCAEEVGNFDKARQVYKNILDNPDFEGTVFPTQAKIRIDTMADNMGKFVFVDAPPEPPLGSSVETQPDSATEPDTELNPSNTIDIPAEIPNLQPSSE